MFNAMNALFRSACHGVYHRCYVHNRFYKSYFLEGSTFRREDSEYIHCFIVRGWDEKTGIKTAAGASRSRRNSSYPEQVINYCIVGEQWSGFAVATKHIYQYLIYFFVKLKFISKDFTDNKVVTHND